MEVTKVCSKCHQEKSLDGFPYVKRYDRYDSVCKECVAQYQKVYRAAHQDKNREYLHLYRQTHIERTRELRKAWEDAHRDELNARRRAARKLKREERCIESRRYYEAHREEELARHYERRKKNPERARAHRQVAYALKTGQLTREPCKECGDPRSYAHHPDYSKPLDVVWLCRSCHGCLHAQSSKSSGLRETLV